MTSPNPSRPAPSSAVRIALALLAATAATAFAGATLASLRTSIEDFRVPGTQPKTLAAPIEHSSGCVYCHGWYDEAVEPYGRWQASMMAQSARDPLFHACLAIAEQDAPGSGDTCLRCHTPGAWLEGRSEPTDGSALVEADFDGVNCNFCHRLVDPVADAANPPDDVDILAALTSVPSSIHSGSYVVDPLDRRRGPFQLHPKFPWHEWRESPFHRESLLCASCHDVSNPAFSRVGGPEPSASDVYVPNANARSHPTQQKTDQFPLERTYSEWLQSDFAKGPIDLGGIFGGNKRAVSSCQDCHMPDASGEACAPGFGAEPRDDLPLHDFRGANTWVLRAVLSLDASGKLYGTLASSQLSAEQVEAAIARNIEFLQRASDMELALEGSTLRVRVVNQTGHKLPTGYPEGRRMWLNVRFLRRDGSLLAEHGAYDADRALLHGHDTKVYEAELGVDAAMAAATGLPEGPTFHFALNNRIVKDNRIPPRGFTNAGFASVQAPVVGASYADGQHWDDTLFGVPAGAASAKVTLYYQTTSREYVEFLRDENRTNQAGQIAWDLWDEAGRSAPVAMDQQTIGLHPPR